MKKLSEAQLKSMMDMGGKEYAMQECWDIQQAAAALGFICAMCMNEMDEPDDMQSLCNIMRSLMEFINGEINEMLTASKQGEEYEKNYNLTNSITIKKLPDGDFLVVSDGEQHLQVKENGKPDHRLMGAAWAALHGGYRGNKYEGPDKSKALEKLKALYTSEGMDTPSEKSFAEARAPELNLSYVKSLGVQVPDLAVKYVAKDTIRHPVFLWGNPDKTDLEREYFTKETDFWDSVLGKSVRPLTWDHAQDEGFKADPLIGQTNEWEDDEIGRWAISVLKKGHQYRKAIDQLIERKSLGSAAIAVPILGASSDSAPQYVKRVQVGKSIWLARWPWFATALTPTPCEPRMIGSDGGGAEFLKSLGIALPDIPSQEWEAEKAKLDYLKLFT